MKKNIIIIFAALLLTSCSAMKEKMDAQDSVNQTEVKEAVESERYKISVEQIFTKRGVPIDLVPSSNYIIIIKDRARLNLAYVGRSYDARGIAAINMSGDVISKSIKHKKKGGTVINLEVRHESDTFDVIINMGKSGYCSVKVTHPSIDYISYRGRLNRLI